VAARSSLARADDRTLVLERVFDAPLSLMWQCWTEPQHLERWSAPRGFTIPCCEGDLRPGGKWRCQMRSPEGNTLWLGGVYREIVVNRRLVMTHAWEEDGMPGRETLVTVRFEDLGGKTRVTLEQAGFDSAGARDGHLGGWSECFDLLAEHLATQGAQS
jgi:uncharacterized protein YndB with AHSA1/START domain